jgi:hypothetical protein
MGESWQHGAIINLLTHDGLFCSLYAMGIGCLQGAAFDSRFEVVIELLDLWRNKVKKVLNVTGGVGLLLDQALCQ